MSGDLTIDNGICVACNLPVTYDEASTDDEVCRRTKPYCTNKDEHEDWRASCLHATDAALALRAELEAVRRERDEAVAELKRLKGDNP